MPLEAGTRRGSAACETGVMVIAAPRGDVRIPCGGAPRVELPEEPPAGAVPAQHARGGREIGQRSVDASGDLGLLCTRLGEGMLAADGAPLGLEEAKALPSSD
jgi:hypothetical protein